jgi:beta-lactamase class A
MISRRQSLIGALLLGSGFLLDRPALAEGNEATFQNTIRGLERRHGGRLGVAIRDTGSNRTMVHRGIERFPLCSTFKCLAAAFVLARVDKGREKLDRRVVYSKADLVTYSPVTEKHADGDGMTIAEICEAAVTLSDNTAGNLMLDSFGGPTGLTGFLRTLDDRVTRLDRRETELGEAAPGDPRDTTSPLAMLGLLQEIVLGNVLSPASRNRLISWLVGNKTGDRRLRAGLPKDWRVGDKTGAGNHNATNDVAVIWPPNRAPLIVTAYYIEAEGSDDERNAVLADVGRFVAMV